MLLIGSRALKFHFSDARDPKDWDLIATNDEVNRFLSLHPNHKDITKHEKKRRFIVDRGGHWRETFEFEIANPKEISSSAGLLNWAKKKVAAVEIWDPSFSRILGTHLGEQLLVANPRTLFLLKRSHITFPIHFWKNIADYHFLKEKLGFDNDPLDTWETVIFKRRTREIKDRIGKKELNFASGNEEFFGRSEKSVKRTVDHDSLHFAISEEFIPLFMQAKTDLTKAELSEYLVNQMSAAKKIKLIQEEACVLAMERVLIPAALKKEKITEEMIEVSFQKFAGKCVVHYLPEWLRLFAADNFREVLSVDLGFWKMCLKNHPTLKRMIF